MEHIRDMWASTDQTRVSIAHTANGYISLSFKRGYIIKRAHLC